VADPGPVGGQRNGARFGREEGRPAGGIRLVVCDLDGTLISAAGVPAPGAAAALGDLAEAGVLVMVCTGRPLAVARPMLARTGLEPAILGTYHGGMIQDLRDGRLLRLLHIPEDSAAAVQWALRQYGVDLTTYREGERRLVTRIIGTGGVGIIAAAGEVLGRQALRATRAEVVAPDRLDVRHRLAVKAEAVGFVAGRLGLPLTAVAAAGDDRSDADMLRLAGRAIAVGDAAGPLGDVPATFVAPAGLAGCLRSLLD
jgi:hydroxymethylpyrimidine pyrophosphatase-like HAD family hydrolase